MSKVGLIHKEYKVIIVDKVANALVGNGEQSLASIRELIRRVLDITDFSHLLERKGNGRRLKKEAEVNVERLRQLVTDHDRS